MTTPLLIALLAGPPLALLALAIAYTAHLLVHRQALTTHVTGHVTGPVPGPVSHVAESVPAAREMKLIEDLQHSVIDLQRQLGAQRDALTELLSDQREAHAPPDQHTETIAGPVPADARANPPGRTPTRPSTARSGVRRSGVAGAPTLVDEPGEAGARELRIRQLLAEGMPERSIARELRIGVEEVQLLATPGGTGLAS